ncbi:DM13 domain-containing protein [Yinghuangia soli]|uniref:DM13 domain-containing protein n=1 Tax=Yinghuangia soli TaxID=2908204 RepID=A0AA41PWH7_9ACTN|nr:DM13 domain-containing protein [Yinghuangia soli]MCF2527213.1 DM13 domain-containing protein [Yinghuangia soli]
MRRLLLFLRKPVVLGVAAVLAVALAFGLYWFQPWKLWVDETVNEARPGQIAVPAAQEGSSSAPAPAATGSPGPAAAAGPVILATGRFISHEHSTKGTVEVLQLADGTRVLRLEDLDTSNGPDLHVWITDAPVKEGSSGWRVFDDGAHKDLGQLKGNKGDQNYTLPADVDLGRLTSVTIWCDRFDVSFGAAQLSSV